VLTQEDTTKIAGLIQKLSTPDEVSFVYGMLKQRRQEISAVKALELRRQIAPGSRVRTSASTKPEYAANQPGTVKRVNSTTVLVRFDNALGRFGNEARVPIAMIEVLLEGDGGR
jgi:hypothetical protein